MSFALVTDTSANLPTAWLRAEKVEVVPFHYAFNGQDFTCLDTERFDDASYYAAIGRGVRVTTSQVTPQSYIDAFTPLLEAGQDVLFIGMSSGISGSYQSAEMAAEELRGRFPRRTIRTLDTLGASLGEGLFVMQAAACRRAGQSLDEVALNLMYQRRYMHQIFTVDDLMHLRRTGRLSGANALLGTVLGIKPLLFGNPEGKIVPIQKARGRKAAIHAMADHYNAFVAHPENQVVGIAQAACPQDAALLAELLRQKRPPKEILTVRYEPVTGSHVGPGALALFFLSDRERKAVTARP